MYPENLKFVASFLQVRPDKVTKLVYVEDLYRSSASPRAIYRPFVSGIFSPARLRASMSASNPYAFHSMIFHICSSVTAELGSM